jgi:phage regulator Rha-like protein
MQISNVTIENKIFDIRAQKVMLDRDLAEMYSVETRVLNQAVKRNITRFPIDFMFQLNEIEFVNWKSQIVISNADKMSIRKFPFAFTEQGVAMLSSILKSEKAIEVNIQIIRIFSKMREILQSNHSLLLKLEKLDHKISNIGFDVNMHDGEIETIFALIKELADAKNKPNFKREPIGFKTQANKK